MAEDSSEEKDAPVHARIIRHLRERPDAIHSPAGYDERFGEGAMSAVWDLITWGEICLLAERGSGARLQLNSSTAGSLTEVWKAYVADGYDRRRGMRLFETREPAVAYLSEFHGAKELDPVSYLDGVWIADLWEGTAVLRREAVQKTPPDR